MEQLSEGWIFGIIKPVIDKINIVLTNLIPNGQIYIVILASALIAYYIKNKYNWGKIAFTITTIVIYSTMRYLSIGG